MSDELKQAMDEFVNIARECGVLEKMIATGPSHIMASFLRVPPDAKPLWIKLAAEAQTCLADCEKYMAGKLGLM